MEKLELYRKYRPQDFSEMVGNEITIKSIRSELQNGSHVFLLSGQGGCGKTTLARIMAKEVGASDLDVHEINSSENRGIDTAREIIDIMKYPPSLDSKAVVFILDECFRGDTLVETFVGKKPISEIKKGDKVYSSCGLSIVDKVWKNKVDLDRLCCVKFNSDHKVFTSVDHLWYTSNGWKPSKDLNSGDILYERKPSEVSKDLSDLWERIQCKVGQSEILFNEMCKHGFKTKSNKNSNLHSLWKILSDEEWTVLLNEMLLECERTHYDVGGNKEDFIKKANCILSNKSWVGRTKEVFGKNDEIKSDDESGNYTKDDIHKNKKWNCGYNKTLSWREWKLLCSSDYFVQFIKERLGSCVGIADKDRCYERTEGCLSYELQGGYCNSKHKIGNRNRRSVTQFSKEPPKRYEENCKVSGIRVESVEIYERGSDDKSEWGWLTDNDISKGFVYFYDLDVRFAHNYFVDGFLVHNCHKWTNDMQNAMLKPTEDVPEHVYFFLCTTDPQKLIAPLKTRCSKYTVESLSEEQLFKVVKGIARQEDVKVSPDVCKRISTLANGSARDAIKILSSVIYLETNEERMSALSKKGVAENEDVIELARSLFKGENWSVIAQHLTNCKNDIDSNPESVRQLIMSYANSVLLKGYKKNAEAMIQAFSNTDTYRNGKYAITVGCLDCLGLINS